MIQSMTQQAIRLGYLPRMNILHTSDSERGQIYIPSVNWMMLGGVILLVLSFDSSSALAAAYGIAVSGAMIINSLMIISVAKARPNQRIRRIIIGIVCVALVFETLFFASNFSKIGHGGWLPLSMSLVIFTLLTTWKKGSELIAEHRRKINIPMRKFITEVYQDILRVPGTALYLASNPNLVPSRLFYNKKHYKSMHETLIFLNVPNEDIPYVTEQERLSIKGYIPGIYSISVRFGFREDPDLTAALQRTVDYGLTIPNDATFFVARTAIVNCEGKLPYWRCALFGWMTRQAESAATYYNLPSDQVVEIGTQITL